MRFLTRRDGSLQIAAVAIAVALFSGTTGAIAGGLITGKDIQNGTIAAKDLKKKLRKKINATTGDTAAAQGIPGEQGPAGATGATGATGANGADGADGADGVDGGNGSKVGPIGFERSSFLVGDIDGQNGWMKTGLYDVEVAQTGAFLAASGYGFGQQALRLSNAVTSGSFGDQTFSRGLADEAGEADSANAGFGSGDVQPHFEASFDIGTTQSTQQTDLQMTVSPDPGDGGRMSYLRFEDQADGVHVVFFDVQGTDDPANFVGTDIATLTRSQAHTVGFAIDFVPGESNDVVEISIDGAVVHTGTTWENYYRFDTEQAGGNNLVPSVDKLLFRAGGDAAPGTSGQGFLVDDVRLASLSQ